ncbi:hypothetical protein [Virgisporangium aurantiacum]|uniref:Uncharacterized protein n=1 Tax=Virgisporangium aurantiacum TaxID=175570 RepID=A0A8J3ZG73_9ACTN|nr:hypothetical protein [Virgisporangium aurantiacum]GIJ63544.1 hypothetical protein Vau01_110600 [Virgisporangium aurantiacum]
MPAAPLTAAWQPVDPGPAPRSPLLDSPPVIASGQLPAAHRRWRAAVEADERRLAAAHAQRPVWFPVPLGGAGVLPMFGGTPAAWATVIPTLATSAVAAGYARIRVVNLSPRDLFSGLRDRARSSGGFTLRCDTVAGSGSSVDLFSLLSADQLAVLIVDAYRTSSGRVGAVDATRAVEDVLDVLRVLSGPATLARLHAAIGVALGNRAQAADGLSARERRALSDYHADVVAARQPVADRLADRQRDISGLMRFRRSAAVVAERSGHGTRTVRTFEVGAGRAAPDVEIGRALLATSIARGFDEAVAGDDLLLVAGADRLAPEILDRLIATGLRPGKRLVLLCETIGDGLQRLLGHAGSTVSVFLRLPNAADARLAAEHLGREFTFVVNGVSIAEGKTTTWSDTLSQTSGLTQTRGANWSTALLFFARDFGRSVSTSFTTGSGITTSHGGSAQTTRTTSLGRVHEYIVQPEMFQRLEETCMVIVDHRTATLASCDARIPGSSLTSTLPLAP